MITIFIFLDVNIVFFSQGPTIPPPQESIQQDNDNVIEEDDDETMDVETNTNLKDGDTKQGNGKIDNKGLWHKI